MSADYFKICDKWHNETVNMRLNGEKLKSSADVDRLPLQIETVKLKSIANSNRQSKQSSRETVEDDNKSAALMNAIREFGGISGLKKVQPT